MALEARICPKCGSKGLVPIEADKKCFCGGTKLVFNVTKDEYVPIISKDDALAIYNVTRSTEIIDAMIELKQKDIIEYGLKLSQFRNQLEQKYQANQQDKNQVCCPKCGSSNITTGQRGYSLLTGFIGAGNTVN